MAKACPAYLSAGFATPPLEDWWFMSSFGFDFHRRSEPARGKHGSEARGRAHSDLQENACAGLQTAHGR